jgi:hypothetical protein
MHEARRTYEGSRAQPRAGEATNNARMSIYGDSDGGMSSELSAVRAIPTLYM